MQATTPQPLTNPSFTSLPEDRQRQRQRSRKVFRTNYRRANAFLDAACHLYAEDELEVSVFMLQQGTELMLRGALHALTGKAPHTHELEKLLKQVHRYAPEPYAVFPMDAEAEVHLVRQLQDAHLKARYELNYHVNYALHTLLTKRVEQLYQMIEGVVMARLAA